jgi:hypothetical protein
MLTALLVAVGCTVFSLIASEVVEEYRMKAAKTKARGS